MQEITATHRRHVVRSANGDRPGPLPIWHRLAVTTAAPVRPQRPLPAPEALRRAMAVVGLATGGAAPGTRAAPSAGGIYPYELHLLVREKAGPPVLYRVDPAARTIELIPVAAATAPGSAAGTDPDPDDGPDPGDGPDSDDGPDSGSGSGYGYGYEAARHAVPAHGALVVLAARPWLSMRKYGDRGYLYTQLDTAHAAAALGLAAAALGVPHQVRQRPDTRLWRGLLGEALDTREVHSTVVFRLPAAGPAPWNWELYEAPLAASRAPQWLERANWDALGLPDDGPAATADATALPDPDRSTPNPNPNADPSPDPSPKPNPSPSPPPPPPTPTPTAAPPESREPRAPLPPVTPQTIAARRSASSFAGAPLPPGALRHVLDRLRTPPTTDLPADGTPLGVTLLLLDDTADPQAPPGTPEVAVRRSAHTGRDRIEDAFLGQAQLCGARAVVLFHAPSAALTDRDAGPLREAAFRAGFLGQLVYLGATEADAGVTGVGGFDSARWRELAGLPAGHEVVYLVALGTAAHPAGGKLDRAEPAYAHGER